MGGAASGLAESFGRLGCCQCAWKNEEYEALWFAEEQTGHGNPEHGSASEAEARAQKVKYPSASNQEGMQDSRCQRKPKSQPWQPLDSRQWLQSHVVQLLLADPFGFAKIDYGARDDVSARPSSTHGGPQRHVAAQPPTAGGARDGFAKFGHLLVVPQPSEGQQWRSLGLDSSGCPHVELYLYSSSTWT